MKKLKEKIIEISKYIIIFVGIVAVLTTLLTLTALIPKEKIEKNIQESIKYIKSNTETIEVLPKREYSYLHVYADEMILNIIYCMDSNTPLTSVMIDKYYSIIFGSNIKKELAYQKPSLELAIQNNGQGNIEYIRYWHGSIILIRPLLTIMNIHTIYIINAVILSSLFIILILLIVKRKAYILIFAIIIGGIATASYYVPFCLEYYWTYLIMLITSIIAIKIDRKDLKIEESNKKLTMLFFITGIITCFLDFFTTELITIIIPIIMVILIRYKEKRISSMKNIIKDIMLWIILWFIGYSLMWIAKWLLASIVLHENALIYVTDKVGIRISPEVGELAKSEVYLGAITRNITTLYPYFWIKKNIIIAISIAIAIIVAILILKKEIKENKFDYKMFCLLITLGILPYIRYILTPNHAYKHSIFMFREQIITIMAIILAIYIIIDKSKFKKQIRIKNTKRK